MYMVYSFRKNSGALKMSICLALTDADWAITKDVFSILGTLVSASAVGVAFYFGRAGLSTWRDQLRETAYHELSRRLLIELYEFRDSIHRGRSSYIYPDETQPLEEAGGLGRFGVIDYYGEVNAFRRRIRAMDDARQPLAVSLIEAEVLWGKELGKLLEKVFLIELEFMKYINLYLTANNPNEPELKQATLKGLLADLRDVREVADEQKDTYLKDLNAALSPVEKYLKLKLVN